MPASTSLPIWQIHSDILGALRSRNRAVLVAPTGSGKTTQVPQMLLDAGLAGSKKIVVLQPRRVAARTVAARVAWERGGKLGDEVGYQIRFDDQTSLGTRICFVTEGILLRWLQDDRTLADVGIILFDEFHERNLFSDVALALTKQLQGMQRPDLKMVVMSATLDAESVAEYLECAAADLSALSAGDLSPSKPEGRTDSNRTLDGFLPGDPGRKSGDESPHSKGCPVLISEGRSFPVEVHYLDCHDERPVTEQAADAVGRIVNSGEAGDILIFMPGMGEINATIGALRALRSGERLALIPLHGELPPQEQDVAFAPNSLRKVVVATNVAETSVTIDGIRHVVDSGQARVARYDAERGIGTLFIEDISRASAEQRKGRAGRTAPGTCYRLWTESGQLNRPERNTPEIQRTDLAEAVLLLHSLGIKRAAEFDWLDKPDPLAVQRAEELLRTLGALRPGGRESPRSVTLSGETTGSRRQAEEVEKIRAREDSCPPRNESDLTPIGRQMLRLPMHPRYSRMLVEASQRGCVRAAALCAALVGGRDLLMRLRREDTHIAEARELFEASQESDFFTLMRAYQFSKKTQFNVEQCRRYGIHAQTARQVEQTYDQIVQIARKQGLMRLEESTVERSQPEVEGQTNLPSAIRNPQSSDDGLLRSIMAGFIDQLCVRRDQGTLECELTGGRHGTLMRESVVQNARLFVAASIREVPSRSSENLTLLGLASAVKPEWLQEMFPQHLTTRVEHLFDRTHKRVAAIKLIRFGDLVIHHEHQREVDPAASGRCLAEAHGKGWFELPLFNHESKQFIARVNLVVAAMPELEVPAFDSEAITTCLAQAFEGLTLSKEAQATPLRDIFYGRPPREQVNWIDELAPISIPWPDGRKLKLTYAEKTLDEDGPINPPELQVKLHECFSLKEHPRICEGKIAVKFWLCAPDGKRLESTVNWPAFKANLYPKLKPALQKKYPGLGWL